MRLDLGITESTGAAFWPPPLPGCLLPVRPALAGLWADSGFTHGVASGDPGPDSIKLWTRYAAKDGRDATLKVEVASDTGFRKIIARSEAVAGAATWGTAQARHHRPAGQRLGILPLHRAGRHAKSADRPHPGAAGRASSHAARSRCSAAPTSRSAGSTPMPMRRRATTSILSSTLAIICTSISPRHLPRALAEALAGREIEGAGEMLTLDSYRQRYASYRVDPALQELHRRFPMIAIWDDHEFANDAWQGGAENHQPDEGDWFARKAIAKPGAHGEWLPGPTHLAAL